MGELFLLSLQQHTMSLESHTEVVPLREAVELMCCPVLRLQPETSSVSPHCPAYASLYDHISDDPGRH